MMNLGPIPVLLQKIPLSLQAVWVLPLSLQVPTTFVTGTNRYRHSDNGTFLLVYLYYERTYPTNVHTRVFFTKNVLIVEASIRSVAVPADNRYRKSLQRHILLQEIVTGNRYRDTSLQEIVTGNRYRDKFRYRKSLQRHISLQAFSRYRFSSCNDLGSLQESLHGNNSLQIKTGKVRWVFKRKLGLLRQLTGALGIHECTGKVLVRIRALTSNIRQGRNGRWTV